MNIPMNMACSYGFGLPNESQTDKVQDVATLSKWRQSWRIKQPQAAKTNGQSVNHSSIAGVIPAIYSVFGAWVGSLRKRPNCAIPLVGTALRLPDPPLAKNDQWTFKMIYTFLVTANRGRIADIQRIRTISVSATTENAARLTLSGLPLVFLSRSPARGLTA